MLDCFAGCGLESALYFVFEATGPSQGLVAVNQANVMSSGTNPRMET